MGEQIADLLGEANPGKPRALTSAPEGGLGACICTVRNDQLEPRGTNRCTAGDALMSAMLAFPKLSVRHGPPAFPELPHANVGGAREAAHWHVANMSAQQDRLAGFWILRFTDCQHLTVATYSTLAHGCPEHAELSDLQCHARNLCGRSPPVSARRLAQPFKFITMGATTPVAPWSNSEWVSKM